MMHIVSIKQPWATLIAQGVKDVENRSWSTNLRTLVAVHASLRADAQALPSGVSCNPDGSPLALGAIVGVVRIIDCVQDCASRWAEPGAWHWVLDDATPLITPIPYRGRLGLMPLHPATARAVLRRVA